MQNDIIDISKPMTFTYEHGPMTVRAIFLHGMTCSDMLEMIGMVKHTAARHGRGGGQSKLTAIS